MEKDKNQNFIDALQGFFNTDKIITKDVADALQKSILDLLLQFKKDTVILNKETKDTVDQLLNAMLDKYEKQCKEMSDRQDGMDKMSDDMEKEMADRISEVKYLIQEFKKVRPQNGVSPKIADIVSAVLAEISQMKPADKEELNIEPMSGEEMIDSINETEDNEENKIRFEKIAFPEDWLNSKNNTGMGMRSPTVLSQAVDLDFSTRSNGYVISWNATKKRFELVAQSGGGGGGSQTLADTSTYSTDATTSTYSMTSAVNVLFKNAATNTVLAIDEANQRIVVGASATDNTAISSSIALLKNGIAFMQAFGYGAAGSSGGFFTGYAATGTAGSPGAVTSGSTLVALSGRGYDGTSWTSGSQASILLQASELWSSTARGTNIVFNTTPNTTTTNTGVGVWGQNGNLAIGTTTPQVARLGVAVTRSAANPSNVAVNFQTYSGTFTDTSGSGTVAQIYNSSFGTMTFAASSAVTYTNGVTLHIGGAPTAGSNVTFTNSWALYVAGGQSGFGGAISPLSSGGSTLGTSSLPWGTSYLGSIELGNASDTTISRSAAGIIAVEGIDVLMTSATQTVTNKTINASSNTITNLTTAMFAANVVDTDTTLAANSDTRLASQKAIKAYVDNYITGLAWKQAVRVATTANGTLATAFANGQTVDGVVLATGDRILLKNQSSATENGIYIVAASGAPARSSDADTGVELVSATVFVKEGTANADTQWTCTNNDTITIGATSIAFAQVSGAGTYTNGTGLTLTGNVFAIDSTVATLAGSQALSNKTYNGLTLTATTGTFTLTNGKTLSVSNTLTFTGTDGSSVAFGAGGTVLYNGGALGTPSSGTLTNATGLPISGLVASTSTAIGVGSIELGHASDTTLARVSAGVVSIEGVNVVTVSSTDTLSNKTLTAPKFASGGFIADANGNELFIFTTTASAVNELTYANAATGNAPSFTASGSDTDINIQLTPKGAGIVKGTYERFSVRLIDSATAITTGTSKGGDFRISSKAITIKKVGAYVDTAPTGGSLLTIDINEAGTTIMATNKITLDASEKTSETAATAPGVTDTAIAADAVVTFDVDQVGSTVAGSGLVVWIEYVYA